MSGGLLEVLRERRFRTVVSGQGLSMIGDAAFEIALAWAVLQTTGSVTALTSVLLVQVVPRSVLLLFGGALVDRFSPRAMLAVAYALSAAAMTVAAVLAVGGPELWHLYALAVVMGVASSVFVPASESILPHLVRPERLDRANAVQGFLEQLSYVVGPMLGGLLVAAADVWVVFALNAVTFAVATLTALAAPRVVRGGSPAPWRAVVGEIVDGLRHARRSREMRLVLLVVGAATLSYSGVFAVGLPTLATDLSGDPRALALMVTGWGVGQLLGAVAAAFTGLPRRWGLLIIAMTLAEGVMFAALGLVPSAWMAALLLGVVGIGVSYSSDVALPTFVQTRTPSHLLGRVTSLINLPRAVLEPVSVALLGLALAQSVQIGFAIAALPVVIVGVWLALDPFARNLESTSAPDG